MIMNDSSQVIHNVKKTATRVIQRYLGLLVEERCPDKESWIKEVARIREEACRRKDEEPRYKASYEAVIRQIEHIGLENVNMSSWDLTALRTIVLHIHPLEIWLPDAQYKLFVDVREQIKDQIKRIQKLAHALAKLDVLQGFAVVSENHQFVKPELTTQGHSLEIKDGWHPVVEEVMGRQSYVPNDRAKHVRKEYLYAATGINGYYGANRVLCSGNAGADADF